MVNKGVVSASKNNDVVSDPDDAGQLVSTINGFTRSAVNLGQMTAIGAVIVFCLLLLGGGFYFLSLGHKDFQVAIQGANESHKILVASFESAHKELRNDFKETINDERKVFRETVSQMIQSDRQQHEENRKVLVTVQESLNANRQLIQEVVKLVSVLDRKTRIDNDN